MKYLVILLTAVTSFLLYFTAHCISLFFILAGIKLSIYPDFNLFEPTYYIGFFFFSIGVRFYYLLITTKVEVKL